MTLKMAYQRIRTSNNHQTITKEQSQPKQETLFQSNLLTNINILVMEHLQGKRQLVCDSFQQQVELV